MNANRTWYGISLLAMHAAALLLLSRGLGLWAGVGVVCGVAFLFGLLAGALRIMNPMDADAVGELVSQPSTLPGRQVPILLLSVVFGIYATPIAGLLFYLVFAFAKSCLDPRVIGIYGLVIVSALILSFASHSGLGASMLYSRAMLPAAMVGWAFSSFFRSDAWG